MPRRGGYGAEEAEAHRGFWCGVVAGGPAQAERRRRRLPRRSPRLGRVAYGVDERDGGAASVERGVVRCLRDVRVAGDVHGRARLGEEREPADVVFAVHFHHLVPGGWCEGLEVDELARSGRRCEVRVRERVEDGGDAEVGLRVALAHVLHRGRGRVDESGGLEGVVVEPGRGRAGLDRPFGPHRRASRCRVRRGGGQRG